MTSEASVLSKMPRGVWAALTGLLAVGAGFGMSLEPGGWLHPTAASRLAPYHLVTPKTGGLEHEIAFYQQRIAKNPKGYMDASTLGGVYLRQARATGDPSWFLLADQAARRSLANMPDGNSGAQMVLARVAIARHDFPEALAITREVAKTQPGSVLSSQVTIFLALGRVAEAARNAEFLVKSEPNLESMNQLALVRVAQGRDSEAEALFLKAISREQTGEIESSTLARTWLGRIHFKHGQLADAEDLYQEALRIIPDYPVTRGLLGDLALRRARYTEAADHYARAFARNQSAAFLVGQARALELAGKPAEAAPISQQAEVLLRRDLSAGSFGHRRDLARMLLDRGTPKDSPEALSLMTTEMHLRRDPETMNLLARALLRSDRAADAKVAIDQALAAGVQDAEMRYRLAAIDQRLGDQAGALEAMGTARTIDPTFSTDPSFRMLVAEGLKPDGKDPR